MKKFKKMLMELFFVSLFVFAACKNNYVPEQVKVADNLKKETMMKFVAIIKTGSQMGDVCAPKGTIIQVVNRFLSESEFESVIVSDEKGGFELIKPKYITGYRYVMKLHCKEEEYISDFFYPENFKYRPVTCYFDKVLIGSVTKIKGVEKRDGAFVPRGTTIGIVDGSAKLEDVIVSDDEGHFESANNYLINDVINGK